MWAASSRPRAVLPMLLGPGPRYSQDPLPHPEAGKAAVSEIASDFGPLAGLAHFYLLSK